MFHLTPRAAAVSDKLTWLCLNDECSSVFDANQRNPSCPNCGNVKLTRTVPQIAIRHENTTNADSTLRRIAGNYGLTNLRSAREGEAAHPGTGSTKIVTSGPSVDVGLGLNVKLATKQGPKGLQGAAYSEFQATGVSLTGKVPLHGRYKRKSTLPPARVAHAHRDERRR